MLVATTGHLPTGNSLAGKPGLPGGPEAVDVLHPRRGRQDGEEASVEQSPKPDRGGVSPDASKGVCHDVRRSGELEARQGVQYGAIALGEHGGDTAAAAMTELTTSGRAHGRIGFLTGRPQIGHGT
jgi:hypothetical protein